MTVSVSAERDIVGWLDAHPTICSIYFAIRQTKQCEQIQCIKAVFALSPLNVSLLIDTFVCCMCKYTCPKAIFNLFTYLIFAEYCRRYCSPISFAYTLCVSVCALCSCYCCALCVCCAQNIVLFSQFHEMLQFKRQSEENQAPELEILRNHSYMLFDVSTVQIASSAQCAVHTYSLARTRSHARTHEAIANISHPTNQPASQPTTTYMANGLRRVLIVEKK